MSKGIDVVLLALLAGVLIVAGCTQPSDEAPAIDARSVGDAASEPATIEIPEDPTRLAELSPDRAQSATSNFAGGLTTGEVSGGQSVPAERPRKTALTAMRDALINGVAKLQIDDGDQDE